MLLFASVPRGLDLETKSEIASETAASKRSTGETMASGSPRNMRKSAPRLDSVTGLFTFGELGSAIELAAEFDPARVFVLPRAGIQFQSPASAVF